MCGHIAAQFYRHWLRVGAGVAIAGFGLCSFEESIETLATVVATFDEVVGDLDQITDRDDIEILKMFELQKTRV